MSSVEQIPFLDMVTPHLKLEQELMAVFSEALKTGRFIGGPAVDGFEKDFADFCQAKYCIGVASGTDALRFALIAAGIKHGDEVITVPNTFIATTEAISQAGAHTVFIDINEITYNIDIVKLREFIETKCDIDDKTGNLCNRHTGRHVKAIIPVHLYGQMADMDAITEIAGQYNMVVIEDACQAHGAEYFSKKQNKWIRAGSAGLASAFSFYPGKNLGACGEAGAITTNDGEIAKKIRMIRDHGQAKKYFHDIEGYNGRLDAIQASILQIKLRHLSDWNERRIKHALRYNELLGKTDGIIIPHEPQWSRAVYHLYVIRTRRRDSLQEFLSKMSIFTGLHYPVPLHLQKAYAGMGYNAGDYPISEKVASEILSLPMFPDLTHDQQRKVVDSIKEFIGITP